MKFKKTDIIEIPILCILSLCLIVVAPLIYIVFFVRELVRSFVLKRKCNQTYDKNYENRESSSK